MLTVFSVSIFVYKTPHDPTYLSYKVESYDEAVFLSKTHQLTLQHVSPSGIATFKSDDDVDYLLKYGFGINQTSTVQAPPYNITTDTYINEQYALEMMETYDAWDIVTGDASVMVAIIDTGIDINHLEFQGRLSPISYNATTEQIGLDHVIDDQGHGTAVTGVIAANKDNNEGIAGIAQATELLIIKANETGEDAFYDSVLAEAIYYAVDNGADIINMSLGGAHANQTVQDAITYAFDHDVIVVAAAGNDGIEEPQYPAAYEHVIGVSSVDEDGFLSAFSNYGDYIDIAAPGGDIITTGVDDTYYIFSGTSFAAPQITGVLALIKSLDTTKTNIEILNNLYGGITDLNDPLFYGAGLVNTYQSVNSDYIQLSFDTPYDGVDPLYHPKAEAITELPFLNEDDKLFLGWYLDSDLTIPFEMETVLETDTVFYAKWVDETYTLTLYDESNILDETVYSYQDIPSLDEPTKDGYAFNGWYLDIEMTDPYTPKPITEDITLYAGFDALIYHNVTIMDDDHPLTTYEILDDTPIDDGDEIKPHHAFEGYYKDQALTDPFDEATEITEDITLYAKFIPNTYTITYVQDDTVYSEQSVTYDDDFTLLEIDDDTLYFMGWYLDPQFESRYQKPEVLKDDITLYAYLTSDVHEITLHIDDDTETRHVLEDATVALPSPKKIGHVFVGWYTDSDFTTEFTDAIYTKDITLYAKFAKEHYVVTFYAYDRETVFKEMLVSYNDPIPTISEPTKPATTHFTYTFNGWESETDTVTSTMAIYPIFDKLFITNSVSLNPNIDTVDHPDAWTDSGVTYDEDVLNVETTIPDMSGPGTYVVNYRVYDGETNYETLTRYVTIRDVQPALELTLKKGITSLFTGDTFVDPGVDYNRGTLTVDSTVNTAVPGTYTVTYTLRDDQQTRIKTRYVHVMASEDAVASLPPFIYTRKKEGVR